ncbi:MAG TPA: hypothetical protein VJ874_03350 [Candidatus Thermoplasmatota archaeon]|nr:hypothetical protein [Candidatus Thermoplasmatota archaeon]
MNRASPVPALAVLSFLGLALLAGCASTPDECGDGGSCANPNMAGYTAPTDPIPEEGETDGHDHADPLQHRFASNASLVAYDDLRRFGWSAEVPVGAHVVDLAPSRGLLAVGVNGGHGDEGQQGFHLFDVSEPARLVHLSYYESDQPVGGDRTLAFSGDGQAVFLGYEGDARPGVAAIDVSDPAAPREVAFWDDPQGFGSHTISAGAIGGVEHVFSLAMGVNILRYDQAGFTLVGKYLTADQLAALDAVGMAVGDGGAGPAQTYALRALYGHDMTFFQDPVTGKPLLFVAYAYEGFKAVDLTVPSAPVLLFRWQAPADTSHKHYVHSVEASRLDSGQLLLVVGSETFEPENQGIASPIWILDGTAAVLAPPLTVEPTHVSTWRNPGGATAGSLGLSVHFFRLEDGLLYLSHYHGGIWGVDLRTPEAQADPQHFGYIMPVPPDAVRPPQDCCIGFDLNGTPMVFDVEVHDGVAYGADIIQGLTATRFARPQ